MPLCEFTENDLLFQSLFPHLFLLGKFGNSVTGTGGLPMKFVDHLLHQKSVHFAHDSRFIFAVFNQKQRHAVAKQVSLRAIANKIKMIKLGEFLKAPEAAKIIEEAFKNNKGPEAKQLLCMLQPFIRIIGANVDYSPMERSHAITDLYSYVQYFGTPSVFLTIAPDDTHSVMSIRMSYPTSVADPEIFPSTNGGISSALDHQEKEFSLPYLEHKIDISEFGLQDLLASNPVAAATIYKKLIDAVFEQLLGIQPNYKSKVTKPYVSRRKGIFGKTRAVFSVTEVQGRLSLHAHTVT